MSVVIDWMFGLGPSGSDPLQMDLYSDGPSELGAPGSLDLESDGHSTFGPAGALDLYSDRE